MKSGKSRSNKWNKKSENTRDVIREKKNSCPLLTLPKDASLSVISKVLNDHLTVVESKTETTSASPIHYDDYSNCFPCYSSDTVLVKDIGITCDLIKPKLENQTRKKNKTKTHRDEFISLTRKISTYTKEIITNLCDKSVNKSCQQEKKKNYRKKIPVAREYLNNEGQVCLQLRLVDSDRISEEPVQFQTDQKCQDQDQNIKTIFSRRVPMPEDNWSTQTLTLYNYLTTGKKETN